jgi:hypothetical protein
MAGQKWAYGNDHTLTMSSSCLTPATTPPVSGVLIQKKTCITSSYQTWLLRSDKSLFNATSGLCVTDTGQGQQLTLATCVSGATGQQWTFS